MEATEKYTFRYTTWQTTANMKEVQTSVRGTNKVLQGVSKEGRAISF